MTSHWPEIIILIALVGVAAFFAASEAAIVSINRIRARALAEKSVRGAARLTRLVEDRNRTLTSVLIGSTFVLLAADSVATYLFIQWDIPHAAVWSTIVMTVVILVFGEILPKTLAVGTGDRTALRLAPLLGAVTRLMAPLTAAFLFVTDGLVRVFGGKPHVGPYVTEDDIKTLVNVGVEQNVLEEQERELIHSIIEFGDTIVREVMTPRTETVTVAVSSSPRRALDLVIAEGYSKLPVYEETDRQRDRSRPRSRTLDRAGERDDRFDDVALADASGHARPGEQTDLRAAARDAARQVLARDRARRVRRYGRTRDDGRPARRDRRRDSRRARRGRRRTDPAASSDDEAVVEAGTNIEDVNNALGIALPHEEFETIGGFTVGLFGRLPREGEEIEAGEGIRLRVDRTRGRRILAVRVLTTGKASDVPQAEPAAIRD